MAGLYAHPYAYYEPPFELVEHPHERLHQHNTFLGVMTRRKSNQKAYPNHPDVDVSDAISYYLIELEVPGIKDAGAIALHWTSSRSFVVTGSTFRTWEPEDRPDSSSESNVANPRDGTTVGVGLGTRSLKDARDKTDYGDLLPPYLVIGERKIGSFRREFHFPVEVEVENTEAKLVAGLLSIKVPKKSHMYLKGSGKVKVQSMD